MNLKNKIAVGLCVAVATVSFLYPFPGKIVYAEQVEEAAGVDNETEISEESEETKEAEAKETSEETEEMELNICEENPAIAMLSVVSEDSCIGILAVAPEEGQENRYEYTGSEEEWTVPVTGYYTITCAGGNGLDGWVSGSRDGDEVTEGKASGGSRYKAQFLLKKNEELTVHVGGQATSSWGRGRGWSDGGSSVRPDESNHCYGGDGGGSSYLLADSIKIVSAKGGSGGDAKRKNDAGYKYGGYSYGGAGGGVTCVNSVDETAVLVEGSEQSLSSNAGNGYITITLDEICLGVSLDAPTDWTNQDVKITAGIISEGEGLPEKYLSWETDEEGNDIWTDMTEYTVSQNGTYTCKIRDVAGNIEETTIEITNIDRLEPEGEITADITDWTRENVQLTAAADDAEETTAYGKSGLMEKAYLWGEKSEAGENVYEQTETVDADTGETRSEDAWTDAPAYTATQNGTYLCRIRDKAGNETVCEYIVTNIDRTAPEITCDRPGKWYEGDTTVTWQGKDIQPDGSMGCGLHEFAYSYDGIRFDNQNRQLVKKEGTYCVWVRDQLGNIGMAEMTFHYDKRKDTQRDNSEETETEQGTEILTEEISAEELTLPKIVEQNTGDVGVRIEEKEMQQHEPKRAWPQPVAVSESLVYQEREEQKEVREVGKEKEQLIEKTIWKNDKVSVEVEQKRWNMKRVILYSVWMVVIFCGLLWLLFCLLFEHAIVYRREKGGSYYKIGRCAILRKKEYLQINLIRFMKKKENRDYMLRFSGVFVWLHKKRKVLVRTGVGVELRNMTEKIEILSID